MIAAAKIPMGVWFREWNEFRPKRLTRAALARFNGHGLAGKCAATYRETGIYTDGRMVFRPPENLKPFFGALPYPKAADSSYTKAAHDNLDANPKRPRGKRASIIAGGRFHIDGKRRIFYLVKHGKRRAPVNAEFFETVYWVFPDLPYYIESIQGVTTISWYSGTKRVARLACIGYMDTDSPIKSLAESRE